MPLVKSPSKAAFRKNVAAEIKSGKPVAQSVAIAYPQNPKTPFGEKMKSKWSLGVVLR